MSVVLPLTTRLTLARFYLMTPLASDTATGLPQWAAAALPYVDVVEVRVAGDELGVTTALSTVRSLLRPDGILAVRGPMGAAGVKCVDAWLTTVAHPRPTTPVMIGRTCASPDVIAAAVVDDHVHYCVVDTQPETLDYALQVAPPCNPASKPWFAAGGIDATTLGTLLDRGVRRIAVGQALRQASDPQGLAADMSEQLRQAWNHDPAMERLTLQAFRWM